MEENIFNNKCKIGIQGKSKATLNGRLPGTPLYISGDDSRLAQAGLLPMGGTYIIAPGVVANSDGYLYPEHETCYGTSVLWRVIMKVVERGNELV